MTGMRSGRVRRLRVIEMTWQLMAVPAENRAEKRHEVFAENDVRSDESAADHHRPPPFRFGAQCQHIDPANRREVNRLALRSLDLAHWKTPFPLERA